jgi:hypothetical protein
MSTSARVTVNPKAVNSGTRASSASEPSTMIGIPNEWQALLPAVRWNAA